MFRVSKKMPTPLSRASECCPRASADPGTCVSRRPLCTKCGLTSVLSTPALPATADPQAADPRLPTTYGIKR